MKRKDLKKLALLGLTGGLVLVATSCEPTVGSSGSHKEMQKAMSAAELYAQLSPAEKQEYNSMSDEGKKLALTLANQDCAGKNGCKGLNSCKSAGHDCKGLGSCKGTTPGPFKDKNDAVKVAAMHMAAKRQAATK